MLDSNVPHASANNPHACLFTQTTLVNFSRSKNSSKQDMKIEREYLGRKKCVQQKLEEIRGCNEFV